MAQLSTARRIFTHVRNESANFSNRVETTQVPILINTPVFTRGRWLCVRRCYQRSKGKGQSKDQYQYQQHQDEQLLLNHYDPTRTSLALKTTITRNPTKNAKVRVLRVFLTFGLKYAKSRVTTNEAITKTVKCASRLFLSPIAIITLITAKRTASVSMYRLYILRKAPPARLLLFLFDTRLELLLLVCRTLHTLR